MEEMLQGAYDFHVHTAPDVTPRKCTDVKLARRLKAAGMAGCVIKNHYMDTAGRAAVLRELFPELDIAGGIVLNRSVGGLNPAAVEKMAAMGGRLLWFPTMDALEYQSFRAGRPLNGESGLITVFDREGRLKTEVYEILKLAAELDLIVGTGHLGAREGMAVLAAGRELKVERMVVTHADNPANRYSVEQQKEAARLGAMIEHCYFTTYYDRTPAAEICRQIRVVGTSRIILSTDFGQPGSPYSDEGLREYGERLEKEGITREEVREMMCKNPGELLNRGR